MTHEHFRVHFCLYRNETLMLAYLKVLIFVLLLLLQFLRRLEVRLPITL